MQVMLIIPTVVRVFLCVQPTDMRKSFVGITGLVQTGCKRNFLDGRLAWSSTDFATN